MPPSGSSVFALTAALDWDFMTYQKRRRYTVALATLLLVSGCATAGPDGRDARTRGEYLVKIMDCGGCHTPGALKGKPDFT